jgi:predicted lysophospholipase L1 biosynthesis ABC-type transport system permease subunit
MRFTPAGPEFTVVGVTGDVLGSGLDQKPDEMVYLPLVTAPGETRFTPREVAFVVRSTGDARAVAAPVEQELRKLAPELPVYHARPMEAVVAHSAARTSFTLQLLGIASLAALLLGAIGIYAVIAHMVALRRREIAVRIALGARPLDVRRMVARQALAITAFGVALGLGAAALLTRFLAALLFGVARGDATTFAAAALVLGAVALAATWLPARRAATVDPAVTLQTE